MTDHPKEPFDNAAKGIRDKDNAKPELKPKFSSRPAANLAPKGHVGIHLSRYEPPKLEAEKPQIPSIVKTHPKPDLLTGGRFLDRPGHGFAVEVNPFHSLTGIEGGKITALEIQQEGKIIAQYQDMKWTVKPDKEEHKQLVQRLQDQFGEPRRDFAPIVPISPGHDRDR